MQELTDDCTTKYEGQYFVFFSLLISTTEYDKSIIFSEYKFKYEAQYVMHSASDVLTIYILAMAEAF